ncbi:MAG: nucleoside-diphosphate sugar epimerase/dehydratase [Ancrocorticia sp.]|uniref:polysaccharide biosynthesis protein n=1 Tax=Ancrocorticia sp. TaxID=2593684 RepID=UPI003F90F809
MVNRWTRFALDALSWSVSILMAALFRHDFVLNEVRWSMLSIGIVLAILLQFTIGKSVKMYTGRYGPGTFEEVHTIAVVVGSIGLVLWIATLVGSSYMGLSRSIMIIASFVALLAMLAGRYIERLLMDYRNHPGATASPALLFGAGAMGSHLIRWNGTDPTSPYRFVGIVDDNPAKRHLRIRNVQVLGKLEDLPAIIKATDAKVLVVAIANVPSPVLIRVHDLAKACGIQVKMMPSIRQILENWLRPRDLRDLSVDDLLGRILVDTHVAEVAGYLTGKRVLVTGAGGSIGSQLCVEIKKYSPKELIMLDRDETALQSVQISTAGNGLLTTPDVVLADIRDAECLKQIVGERRPDVVFHAAALKHLPMLEQYPDEAWKTNVLGTLNVLNAAASAGVTTFVNISTDKAANPTSVLGYSKRVAEKLTASIGQKPSMRYISVRFGNVIGSRGSMLPTFMRLIEEGKPLTVTHPDMTRYFMTIPEACQLVIQAGSIGQTGEVLILDMGDPVRILDIAHRMIAMSGQDIEIVFTGLRDGEKLHEELTGTGETTERPYHPKITHAHVSGIEHVELDKGMWDRTIASRHRAGVAAS